MSDKISYEDVREYEHLFTLTPAFALQMMAKRNSNLVLKFKSTIVHHLNSLDDQQKEKLDIILNTNVEELQKIMAEAFLKTNLKQYKILSDPKNKDFIEKNISELKKLK